MHRLLQGDVGSGKTVVAALAAARCIDAGCQCALMAPTEILAEQHFGKLVGWLDPLLAERGLRVAWLTGSQKKKERDAMAAAVESGEAALVIGTHAVIQEKVRFRRLALAIIDEQHRFGVAQRLALRGKAPTAGHCEPHLLMMSATPIPRTLAMSYYADLDVSTLDELPPGRTPDRHQAGGRAPARRGHRAHPRAARAGPAGLLGLPADRGERGARPAQRHRDARRAGRRARRGAVGSACCIRACRRRRSRR